MLADAMPADKQGIRRSRVVTIRNSYPDLLSTVLKDFLEITERASLGEWNMQSPPSWKAAWNHADGKTQTQLEMEFLALDRSEDDRKIRGANITWAFANEVKELSFANVRMLLSRCGRYPARQEVPDYRFGMIADSQTPDRDHWLAKLMLEPRPDNWDFLCQPPAVTRKGTSWEVNTSAENSVNLPKGYYENLLTGAKKSWIRQNLACEMVFHTDGRPVHPDLSESLHVIDDLETALGIELHIGIDFGCTPAATIGQKLHDGRWAILDELRSENIGASHFGQILKEHLQENFPNCSYTATGDPCRGGDDSGR